MNREESLQIELARVLCITFMMWVHVNPGLSEPSFVNGGPASVVGLVFGQILGRISVTTLSFISGFLFWQTSADKTLVQVVRRLGWSIYLPMLVWSALFILLAFSKQLVLGQQSGTLGLVGPSGMDWLNAWSGLTGPTANLSLFFLRDLVVSSLITYLAAGLIRRQPLLVAVLAVALVLGPSLSPVIFRPTILSFMLFGACAARAGLTLSRISRSTLAVPLGIGLGALALLLTDSNLSALSARDAIDDLYRRAALGFLMLALSSRLLQLDQFRRLACFGRDAFLAYLAHLPIIGVAWVFWVRLVGGPNEPSYTVFYLAAPPATFALAVFLGRRLNRMSPRLQRLLRGKSFRPDQDRFSRASTE